MNQYRNRMIRSIDNRLGSSLRMNGHAFGIPAALRSAVQELLLDVADATFEIHDNLPVVRLADGSVIRDDREHPAQWDSIGKALDNWLENGRFNPLLARSLPLPAGAVAISVALGADIDRLSALTYVTATATIERGTALFSLRHGSDQRLHAVYQKGRLRWRDGIVSVPHGPLPQSLRLALRGRRLSDLVDDPVIGDVRISTIADADLREGVLRVRTVDADRYLR